MKVLVTGGAGFIGSHVARAFLEKNAEVLILDDLSNSTTRRIESLNVEFINASILDLEVLRIAIKSIDLVVHCAALKSVEDSVKRPEIYHEVNVRGTQNLLEEMNKQNKSHLIFSSSAAVYGNAAKSPIKESSKTEPISIYGKTKLQAEEIISRYSSKKELSAVSLRFFNAVGSANNQLGDTSRDNLFPKVFSAVRDNLPAQIYGDDYPTDDGTCIRDYVHVEDIAEAHLASFDKLSQNFGHRIYNVGTGRGYSVKQIINAIQKVAGSQLETIVMPRRQGDLDVAYADTSLIEHDLGWYARFALEDMVKSSWDAWNSH